MECLDQKFKFKEYILNLLNTINMERSVIVKHLAKKRQTN